MISIAPAVEMIRSKLGRPPADIAEAASERLEISPTSTSFVRPAVFLPGQLDRIERTEFGSLKDVIHSFKGDFQVAEGATVALKVRNVDLFNGVLYTGSAARHLRKRDRKLPAYGRLEEAGSGAIFEAFLGNRWFANWLAEDCLTYPLAARFGTPVATEGAPHGRHHLEYEHVLGMAPRRFARAHFEELVLFDDRANNAGKAARVRDFRTALLQGRTVRTHSGVFLLRGQSGDRRLLENEIELAETLCSSRGFTAIDPSKVGVDEMIEVCAGARVVAGVEGSQLAHGIVAMPDTSTLLVLQPPRRTTAVLKIYTDRVGQGYAFVVGSGGDADFRVSIEEVLRTLDLLKG